MRLFFVLIAAAVLAKAAPLIPADAAISSLTQETAPARQAFDTFEALFADEAATVPTGVRVLGVRIRDGALTVNVSGEILNWGGNENERMLIETLIATAQKITGVTHLTLLTEGEPRPLCEGRYIDDMPLAASVEKANP